MLATTLVRSLDVGPEEPGEAAFVSAASGLVAAGAWLYVIADDDVHLFVFPAEGSGPGKRLRLLPGHLPQEREERKAVKPDFEALVKLPPFVGYPHGALLALGSGSTPRRRRGVLVRLDVFGSVDSPMIEAIDLTALYARLEQEISDLNLEGAVVSGDALFLLQRGNGAARDNALIRLELAAFLRSLAEDEEPTAAAVREVHHLKLGDLEGVSLAFSDAAALDGGRMLFSAVAEDTQSTYLDGRNVGSALGILDRQGRVIAQQPLATSLKIEGVAVSGDEVLMVNDSDDSARPASLMRTSWAPLRAAAATVSYDYAE